jgi:hypothetical protein
LGDGSGGALQLIACGGPGPGEKFVETAHRPEVDEPEENIGEIGLRVDALEFAGFDQRRDTCPILGPAIVTGKKSILSRKRLRAHRTLDDVGVEIDAAVIEEASQAFPMRERIADGSGDGHLWR